MDSLRRSLLVFFAFVAAIAVLEVAMHVASPRIRVAVNMQFDEELGHRGVENEIVTTNTFEYYNQAGFRERTLPRFPFQQPRESGRPRVVVVGDSITLGFGIEKESRYTELLERDLLRNAPFETEVRNYGTADYGTLEEYLSFERFAKLVHPELAVLQFLGLNDFLNNGIHFALQNQSHTDAWRPYVIPQAELPRFEASQSNGLWIASAVPFRASLRRWSYLFRMAEGLAISRAQSQPFFVAPGCSSALGLFLKTPGLDWDSSVAATSEIAAQFRSAVEGSGESKFVAVYFPSNVEVVDSMWKDGIEPALRGCYPGAAFDRWEGERKFLAAFSGSETFSLRESFLGYSGDRAALFVPDGHLSVAGHKLAADAISRFLLGKHAAVFRQ